MFKEFKEFIQRGNVMDMAVGVIVGAAFGAIINSLVNDILMPLIGMLTGGMDFTEYYFTLDGIKYANLAAATEAGAPVIKYGIFINTVISFFIIAFVLFLIIRKFNHMYHKKEVKEEPTKKICTFCYTEIPVKASRCPHCTSELK